MSLRDAFPARTIDTSSHDIVGDFFVPMLQNATRYDRGVGYFSSGWLRENAKGMAKFAENGGQARWITSPILSEEDWEYLQKGDRARGDEFLRERLKRDIDNLETALEEDTLSALAWLVADEVLTFRLALPREKLDQGEFHDKFGIFEDAAGHCVSFNGSYNDSIQGLRNYESLKVFCSWDATASFVDDDIERFRKLWGNNDPNVETYPLPEAARQQILKLRSSERPYPKPNAVGEQKIEYMSSSHKWRHQDEAISSFLEEKQGVLEMATGTGKTRTALRISTHLIEAEEISTVIVSTYGTDLLDQWYPKLRKLKNSVSRDFQIYRHYGSHRGKMKFLLNVTDKILLASRKNVPTVLNELLPEEKNRTLLIHDEVHGLGSPANRENLSGLGDNIRFRLGLSATPEREYDEEGNKFIEEHVGPVIYEFGLDDAIRRGILCPLDYVPLEYVLTEEDRERLKGVFRQAAARKKEGNPMTDKEKWIKLAKVRKTSEAKLPVFERFVAEHPEVLEKCIIFVETKEYGEKVLPIVHEHHADFHTYYGTDDDQVLDRFTQGDIECLLTCEKLSEGIDIPALENVILFSSPRAQLKTIQRIGRCLRTDPNNPTKSATVVDFIDADRSTGEDGRKSADTIRMEFLQHLASVEPNEEV
ncbi:superfamily II DNA or RNA helicase [Salinibacter ruber]|uniref:DEAD/DEAH box helicase family protein n=1 Tax=Salinibacter ruber TaxID=146919 RepID=UPI0021680F65|nr:DEAD/DEAH box helicase family protein [Salinibacter ruber]MCS3940381.1 superfamily II DNA or RNA helicase [Salinibacter ruber]